MPRALRELADLSTRDLPQTMPGRTLCQTRVATTNVSTAEDLMESLRAKQQPGVRAAMDRDKDLAGLELIAMTQFCMNRGIQKLGQAGVDTEQRNQSNSTTERW